MFAPISVLALSLLVNSVSAGVGAGTVITFHPKGCASGDGAYVINNPADTDSGCAPAGVLSGGYEIQNIPSDAAFQLSQGLTGGDVCGPTIKGTFHNSGCYDFPNLGEQVWINFCTFGVDCQGSTVGFPPRSYPPSFPAKRAAMSQKREEGVIKTDGAGDFLWANNGARVPVFYGTPEIKVRHTAAFMERSTSPRSLFRRQSVTYTPPDGCTNSEFACNALSGSGSLKLTCIDCITDYGKVEKASPSLDCSNAGAPCPIVVNDSVTVTDTTTIDIGFGATIGDTGTEGGSGTLDFSVGFSHAVATTYGVTLGVSIPVGKIGYMGYQPQASLGTVVSEINRGWTCNGDPANKICGATTGILNTDASDKDGQYGVVITS